MTVDSVNIGCVGLIFMSGPPPQQQWLTKPLAVGMDVLCASARISAGRPYSANTIFFMQTRVRMLKQHARMHAQPGGAGRCLLCAACVIVWLWWLQRRHASCAPSCHLSCRACLVRQAVWCAASVHLLRRS